MGGMGEAYQARDTTLDPDVARKVRSLDGVEDVKVNLVFNPPWTPDMMSEAARLQAGLF